VADITLRARLTAQRPVSPEVGLGDDDQRERAREDEEEDRVETLVGGRADLDRQARA
jgi:hypothetical protein